MNWPRIALHALICAPCLSAGCEESRDSPPDAETRRVVERRAADLDRPLTFNRDIAPIVFERCSGCHRPDESGPFDLLTYRDVKKRGAQIVRVTKSRFMPPWLPEPGVVEFHGDMRLSDVEVEAFARWWEQGATEGDSADLPPLPEFSSGWRLGKPDLILDLPQPYRLAAEGLDVFRNVLFPVPIKEERFADAIELRPGDSKVVHHAVLGIDKSGLARTLDEQDVEVGFGGMESVASQSIDGHFFGWTPGQTPSRLREGMSVRLRPGSDLVLQLHLIPSGKTEMVKPRIGLHFTDQARTQRPVILLLDSSKIDIPAGESEYVVEDTFQVPVDLDVLKIYPHAHYLGKEIQCYVDLPEGGRKWLVHITDWDFNWQRDYDYVEPVRVSAGSRLHMRWTFDNSADNPRNPSQPPRRVQLGLGSLDEMAQVILQVLTPTESGRLELLAAFFRHASTRTEGNSNALLSLGGVLKEQGKFDESAKILRKALEINAGSMETRELLGRVLLAMNRSEEALEVFRSMLRVQPDFAGAHNLLGCALFELGRTDDARPHLQKALESGHASANALFLLGKLASDAGDNRRGEQLFRESIRKRNDIADPWFGLGLLQIGRGEIGPAMASFDQAFATEPGTAATQVRVGLAFRKSKAYSEAEKIFRRAAKLEPNNADPVYQTGSLFLALGRMAEAATFLERAVALQSDHVEALGDLAALSARAQDFEKASTFYERVLVLRPDRIRARLSLAAIRERTGREREAVDLYKQIVQARPTTPEDQSMRFEAGALLSSLLCCSADESVRDEAHALEIATELARVSPENASVLQTLAAAHASVGQFEQAVRVQGRAIGLVPPAEKSVAQERLNLYRAGRPFRRP